MTAPPERITVKRRRDEEPVDALCKLQNSVIVKLSDLLIYVDIPPQKQRRTVIWNRVPADHSCHEIQSQIFPAIGDQVQVPIVRTTLPEEDDASPPAICPAPSSKILVGSLAGSHHQKPDGSTDTVSDHHGRFPTRYVKEHRKFHLTRTSTSTRTPSVLHSGIHKIKKMQKKKLAVFVERTNGTRRLSHPGIDDASPMEERTEPPENSHPPSAECPTPRKRPLASSVERKWRTQNWEQPLESNSETKSAVAKMHEMDTTRNLAELTLELRELALKVSGAGRQDCQMARDDPKAKVRPKPPKPRPTKDRLATTEQDQKSYIDSTDQSGFDEDSDKYVFDVYIRQPEHVGQMTSIGSPGLVLKTADPDKIGVLVIEDDYQETWELYGDDDQSNDEDWNSEEEDENGQCSALAYQHLWIFADSS